MKHKKENTFFQKDKNLMIVLFLWAFVLFGNTLGNDYSMDYSYVINPQTEKGFSALPEIFTTHYFNQGEINYGYRPITKATFAIEQGLWGRIPFLSHLINVLLYAFLGILIFKFLRKIFKDIMPVFSFLIVFVFMAHPTHTEIVASVKNREELLIFIFGILMLLFIWRYIQKRKIINLVWAAISLLIGFWTKPTMIIFVLLIPVILFYFSEGSIKKNLFIFFAFLVASYLFLKLPALFLSHGSREVMFYENPIAKLSIFHRLPTSFSILLFYLKKLIIPFPLLFYYGYNMIPEATYSSPEFFIALILYLAIFFLALFLYKRDKILSFSFLGFLFAIFLFSNIYKTVSGIAAERYLFIASLFFSIFLIRIILKYAKFDFAKSMIPNAKAFLLIAIIVLPYSIITINRNSQWKDELSLFSHDISRLKNSAMANEMYGVALMNEMDKTKNQQQKKVLLDKALQAYQQSLVVYPENKFCLNALASSYFMFYGDYTKAAQYYEQLLPMDSANIETLLNLGFSFENLGRKDKAIQYYKQAIALDSLNPKPYSLIANVYYKSHDLKNGNAFNKKLYQLNPQSEAPVVNLANYYIMLKDTAEAVVLYDSAATIQPNNIQLNTLLYQYYWSRRDTANALKYYNRLKGI
ncbi:MAG: tetratricopeptide repeat protein [Bacteroidales bacterium]|nr:tetratricopeptide repeat protein [Bacteroidales bacterium]